MFSYLPHQSEGGLVTKDELHLARRWVEAVTLDDGDEVLVNDPMELRVLCVSVVFREDARRGFVKERAQEREKGK